MSKRICVFCGSSLGARAAYADSARELARQLVANNVALVYGGGNVGMMGVLADAMLAAGGEAIGVIPQFLVDREVAHTGLTALHVVESMHERKALMAEMADAFIALPGGFGTFDEFCEVLTWSQIGLQHKPCGLLNVNGYYSPLLEMFERAEQEKFLRPQNRQILLADTDPAALVTKLLAWEPDHNRSLARNRT
ncbi:MAG TPA: TIGR00730 family Rossman fold protein [candidate division Zixibacteria bacterium]|nr:TIGR00730 family Rossman fold protein [candidate division Zixibacteria bacterium]